MMITFLHLLMLHGETMVATLRVEYINNVTTMLLKQDYCRKSPLGTRHSYTMNAD